MIKEDNTLLIIILFNNTPIGISTSYPLTTEADMLSDTFDKFKKENKNPKDYFYYSEIIISDSHRLKGLSKKVYKIQEDYAKKLGFKWICLATVLRDENDIRKPSGYKHSDGLWRNLGFEKTNIVIEHGWPTIQPDSTTKVTSNKMLFWEKNL